MVGFPPVAALCLGTRGLVGAVVVSRERPGVPFLKVFGAGAGAWRQSLGVTVVALRRTPGSPRYSLGGP